MELNITTAFVNEERTIRESIDNLAVTNCICSFFEYMEKSSKNEYENRFIKLLNNKKQDFVRELMIAPLQKMTKEELCEFAFELQWDGTWALLEREAYELDEVIRHDYTDAEVFSKIQNLMYTTLNEMIDNDNRSIKQKKLEDLQRRYDDNATYHANAIKRHAETQTQLEEKIEALKASMK